LAREAIVTKLSTIVISAIFFLGLSFSASADVNEQVRERFYEVQDDAKTKLKATLNAKERQELFTYVVNHKVAAVTDENTKKYDPTGEIGYCYGRAMAVHLRARRMGLRPESISKLFIVGDLRQGENPEWRFHVTTLVRGTEGGWYAVDPILLRKSGFKGTPLTMAQWVKTVRSIWAKERVSYLYRVGAESVVPDIRTFPYPSMETGEHLIELKFTPEGKEGFKASLEEGIRYWELDRTAQEKYFLRGKEPVDAEQFNFEKLDIRQIKPDGFSDSHYDYNFYFRDLIDDIRQAAYKPANRERRLGLNTVTPMGTEIHGGAEPQGTEIHGGTPQGTEIHGATPQGTEIHGAKPQGTEIHNLHSPTFLRVKP